MANSASHPSGVGQMSSNPLMMGYKGNRRSGVALAMRHRLSGLSTYGLKGRCVGDEHPVYASGHGPFTFIKFVCVCLYMFSLGSKALNNEFFSISCVEWSERLAQGSQLHLFIY